MGTKKEKVNFMLLTSYGVKAEGQSLHRHVGEKCENCFETGEFGQLQCKPGECSLLFQPEELNVRSINSLRKCLE